MPALHVRNVDDAVISALKKRARKNNRSLEGELRVILEDAAFGSGVRTQGERELRIRTVSVGGDSRWDREEIYDDDGR